MTPAQFAKSLANFDQVIKFLENQECFDIILSGYDIAYVYPNGVAGKLRYLPMTNSMQQWVDGDEQEILTDFADLAASWE